jgi:hypothetical protein
MTVPGPDRRTPSRDEPLVTLASDPVLREQVWMAERITEQPTTSLVEVLPIDEHDDPRRRVGGRSSNGRIRQGWPWRAASR